MTELECQQRFDEEVVAFVLVADAAAVVVAAVVVAAVVDEILELHLTEQLLQLLCLHGN